MSKRSHGIPKKRCVRLHQEVRALTKPWLRFSRSWHQRLTMLPFYSLLMIRTRTGDLSRSSSQACLHKIQTSLPN